MPFKKNSFGLGALSTGLGAPKSEQNVKGALRQSGLALKMTNLRPDPGMSLS